MPALKVRQTPIAELTLPPGWFEDYQPSGPLPTSLKRVFRNSQSPSAEMFIWYRGIPVQSDAVRALKLVLEEPPHLLAPSEVQSIAPALGNMGYANVFKMLAARTLEVARRNICCVEGRWSDDNDALAFFLPPDDAGNILELHYQAPKGDFPLALAAAKRSFSSIKWE